MIWTRQERRKILDGDPKLKMNEVSKAVSLPLFSLCYIVKSDMKIINIFRWEKNGKIWPIKTRNLILK